MLGFGLDLGLGLCLGFGEAAYIHKGLILGARVRFRVWGKCRGRVRIW